MSIVVGCARQRDGGWDVALSADTALSGTVRTNHESKIDMLGGAVIGWTGSPLWRQFARSWLGLLNDQADVEAFASAWFEWAKERNHGDMHGYGYQIGGAFLVGTTVAGLFEITGDAAVCHHPHYAAIGSGDAVASGALFAMANLDVSVKAREAVRAAIEHAPGCGGKVMSIDTGGLS